MLDDLFLLSCKIWSLFFNDEGKELIFKSALRDSEVDQRTLSLDFGSVVRVG